jgi:hypothetical protein
MAIDFALKSAGTEGIYADTVMPDYDFYCPKNIDESFRLKEELAKHLEGVDAYNAAHLTTRKVRIHKHLPVADISYFPEPYFSNVPLAVWKNYVYFHPDFQRIDLHRSLSHLYEGTPGREVFRARTAKDIKRFGLLSLHIPVSEHKIKPINTKNLLMEHFNGKPRDLQRPQSESHICLCGWLAYEIHTGEKVKAIDPPEYITTKFHSLQGEKYEKTMDIFPEAIVTKTGIFYNGEDEIIAAKNGVADIHYLCASFLFKYFMLGNPVYLQAYKTLLTKPLHVTTDYFGKKFVNFSSVLYAQKESCELENKKYEVRPSKKGDQPEDFISYRIAGKKVEKHYPKSTDCPLKN